MDKGRPTIDEVRQYFKAEGYTLLSDEYVNARTHLDYICSNGHEGRITWSKFKNAGQRCSTCSGRRKLTIEEVRAAFESAGYKLLSGSYTNSKAKLDYVCDNGHHGSMRFSNFKKGHRCPVCSGVIKPTIGFVKEFFEKEGYTLLSDTYVNNRTPLEYVCKNGHRNNMVWSAFYNTGSRCPDCAGNVKPAIDKVREYFEVAGYNLISDTYVHSHSLLACVCSNGHDYKVSWDKFKNAGSRCPECSGRSSPTIKHVRSFFECAGYELLSDSYVNNRVPLEYLCPKGHRGKCSWSNFYSHGRRCPVCVSGPVSKISQDWLNFLDVPREYREYRLEIFGSTFTVDAYIQKTNTIYEFLGDYWHGNPDSSRFRQEGIHPVIKKSYGDLYKETMNRIKTFEKVGYNVIYIWEKDFREIEWI